MSVTVMFTMEANRARSLWAEDLTTVIKALGPGHAGPHGCLRL